MSTTFHVAERYPMTLVESTEKTQFRIEEVQIAVKKGLEVQIGADDMSSPDSDCWFAVLLHYPWAKRNNSPDTDTIITDGIMFYLCRRSLGKSKLVFNSYAQKKILLGISKFTKRLINDQDLHSKHRGQAETD
jgi:hypothetical protein